ncbi:MAG: hypothetical protein C4617_04125 [Candidatus Liberibacter europaeus]|uniref:Uncharacterized protein n=1 Tax=Candidatus Liberibacter europaeus TaxID=744859 RepID=A0A2T4VX86_9HYPH|nr:hypothetical protein [Candidatus Liberibacter europaeus]PTL86392.1 MAG: hypothetical protein C4617_04125 [Candidatus Liberibacter europaeus]
MVTKKNALSAIIISSSVLLNGCDISDDKIDSNLFNEEQIKRMVSEESEIAISGKMNIIKDDIKNKLPEDHNFIDKIKNKISFELSNILRKQ